MEKLWWNQTINYLLSSISTLYILKFNFIITPRRLNVEASIVVCILVSVGDFRPSNFCKIVDVIDFHFQGQLSEFHYCAILQNG